jgi:hypothetical protein
MLGSASWQLIHLLLEVQSCRMFDFNIFLNYVLVFGVVFLPFGNSKGYFFPTSDRKPNTRNMVLILL